MEFRGTITTVSTTLTGKEGAQSLVTTVKVEGHLLPSQIEELAVLQKSGFPVQLEIVTLQPTLMR
jgi:hypothetical protein